MNFQIYNFVNLEGSQDTSIINAHGSDWKLRVRPKGTKYGAAEDDRYVSISLVYGSPGIAIHEPVTASWSFPTKRHVCRRCLRNIFGGRNTVFYTDEFAKRNSVLIYDCDWDGALDIKVKIAVLVEKKNQTSAEKDKSRKNKT